MLDKIDTLILENGKSNFLWGECFIVCVPCRSFRESEEDYPLSQEYSGEIEFKVLDLEIAGDSTVEG